jgi:hypothetical protein
MSRLEASPCPPVPNATSRAGWNVVAQVPTPQRQRLRPAHMVEPLQRLLVLRLLLSLLAPRLRTAVGLSSQRATEPT